MDAEELAASITRHVGAGFAQLDGAPVSVSAGIAGAPQQGGDVAALLASAEEALRAAKREPHAA